MKLRTSLRVAAIGLGVAALTTTAAIAPALANSTSSAPSPVAKPTIVLVHGAWADSSSWDNVRQQLQRDGYTDSAWV